MIMRAVGALALAIAPCLPAQFNCQATPAQNEHTFYNKQRTSFATRASIDEIDTIYYRQSAEHRLNEGDGTGWRIVLQDQNQATSETVTLSWHKLAAPTVVPDQTPIASATFIAFGGGTGTKSFIYSFTTATPTALQRTGALGIVLPKPRDWVLFPVDACTLHYQRGDRTKVSAARRQVLSYKLENGVVVEEWEKNGQGPGATFRWGGLYDKPVLQVFNASNAYGQQQDLFGPESLEFETGAAPGRQDSFGFRIAGGAQYATVGNQIAVAGLYLSPQYRTPALPIPPFGTLLINEVGLLFMFYVPTNSAGVGRAIPIPTPPTPANFNVAWQGVFVSLTINQSVANCIELSNAVFTRL